MKHEPVAMVYSHRSNQKHRHNTRKGVRYFNHWFNVYKCPICGRTASRKRQPVICRGVESDRPAALVLCKGELFFQTESGQTLRTEYPHDWTTASQRAEAIGLPLTEQ